MKGNNYIKKKKKQEWEAIKNVITDINEYLDINIIPYNVQYENESPDFVFKNKKTCIGIEVIECHPSVQKNKKDNAPAFKSFQKRIIEEFNNNSYLNEITKEIKLNIIIDQGNALKINTKTVDVCKSLENRLRAWKEGQRCNDTKLIRKIKKYHYIIMIMIIIISSMNYGYAFICHLKKIVNLTFLKTKKILAILFSIAHITRFSLLQKRQKIYYGLKNRRFI